MGIEDEYAAHTIGSLEEALARKDAHIKELRHALKWLTNVCCGVGLNGGTPDCGEPEAAIDCAKAVFAGKGESGG